MASVVAQIVKNLCVCKAGDPVLEESLEKGMATPSSILTWRIP